MKNNSLYPLNSKISEKWICTKGPFVPQKKIYGGKTLRLPNTILAISFKPKFTSTYCGAIENLLSLLAAGCVVSHSLMLCSCLSAAWLLWGKDFLAGNRRWCSCLLSSLRERGQGDSMEGDGQLQGGVWTVAGRGSSRWLCLLSLSWHRSPLATRFGSGKALGLRILVSRPTYTYPNLFLGWHENLIERIYMILHFLFVCNKPCYLIFLCCKA